MKECCKEAFGEHVIEDRTSPKRKLMHWLKKMLGLFTGKKPESRPSNSL